MKRNLSERETMNIRQLGSEAFFNTPSLVTDSGSLITSRLDEILDKGIIRVGTSGDYKPFTYLNPHTSQFEGFDIDVAHLLADQLGVKVQFVQTTWSSLMDDLTSDRFDIAMGGVSRNLERQKIAHLTQPYFRDCKAPLVRREDKLKYQCVSDIDQPSVRIGLNPGGTNERFVRKNIKHANVIVVDQNLSIPEMVATGEVDVMITDHIEAVYHSNLDHRLYPGYVNEKFAKSEKVYMVHRGDLDYQNWIALWHEEMHLSGEMDRLKEKWGLQEVLLEKSI
ncbi:transporter substrate-binding domain-containing protein [Pseudalkalibacillus berkeleyi]|uniref:Transporter substrate-binding domain-containing protein n=1 Tax=Pseudalkalibacillus berkeleyi TaxID=1069813 RepID=A0ABS9H3W4_9BACL|nr:transporter substrate-binding domain-containing protein [Pseudalkalibacillus berkeleyi]MCF6139637.1 transporter substrate-binding domain-containing protein [Pseudalkalibacillus berkeleyi]